MHRFSVHAAVALSTFLAVTSTVRSARAGDGPKPVSTENAPGVTARSVPTPPSSSWIVILPGRIDLGTGIVWRPSAVAPRETPRTSSAPVFTFGPVEGGGAGFTIRF